MIVPYRDLRIRSESDRAAFISDLEGLMDSGAFMMGDAVKRFETQFAGYTERLGSVGVSSGTSALYLVLRGLGIGPGDEVITTSMSWLATANAIVHTGAKPIFVDVQDDLNLSPEAVQSAITTFTRAIVVVHFCGRICEIEQLRLIADSRGVPLIEDASQAAGANFEDHKAGYWGYASAFSLNAMKPLGALGEAGVVISDDIEFLEKIASLRYLGTRSIELCDDPDLNHKIDELQALWLTRRLASLDDALRDRRNLAVRMAASFPDWMRVIGIGDPARTTFFEFTIEVNDRDRLKAHLQDRGIESRIKHPILMCDQTGYAIESPPEVPNARRLVKRILSLPLYASLTEEQNSHLVSALWDFR